MDQAVLVAMTGSPRRYLRLSTAAVTLVIAAAGLPSLSSATGPHDPEISDRCGDVDPSFQLRAEGEDALAFANRTAYDIQAVYVRLETVTDFLIQFRLCDLPDTWMDNRTVSSQIPLGPNASQPMVRLVANFTIKGLVYEARAHLAYPSDGMLREEYVLRQGVANHSLQGAVDVQEDVVTLRVPKSLVGRPAAGDVLTRFRAEGGFRHARLDFAPDALLRAPAPNGDRPLVWIERFDGRVYYEPRFGSDYAFGAFARRDATLRIESHELGRVARAGDTVEYTFLVINEAPLADQVLLTLSQAPEPFAHRLSLTSLSLASGEARPVVLTVAAHESGRGDLYSLVTASSTLGESDGHAFVTRFFGPDAPPPDPPSGGGPVPSDGDPRTSGAGSPSFPFTPSMPKRTATPAPALAYAVAALAGVAFAWRRR